MVVYLLECGCYEQRGVMGVFSTADAAKAYAETIGSPGPWVEDPGRAGCWRNKSDWDAAAEVTPMFVDAPDAEPWLAVVDCPAKG